MLLVVVILVIPSDKKEETQTGQNLPSESPVVSSKTTVKVTQKPPVFGEYAVVKVVDGDTVDLNINDKVERIRLIGMNTPETVDPRKPVECFGKEASNRSRQRRRSGRRTTEPRCFVPSMSAPWPLDSFKKETSPEFYAVAV